MEFKDKLISELTQLDMKEARQKYHNPYALPIYFKAADEVIELIGSGNSKEAAFAECFTPCRGMHTVAKRLGLNLDVQKGHWVVIHKD